MTVVYKHPVSQALDWLHLTSTFDDFLISKNFVAVMLEIFYGSQIPVTTGGLEFWTAYMQCS